MEEQGDMTEARSYMQRGLRFCKDSEDMWLTYARLELLYISKIHTRQKVLGTRNKEPNNMSIEEETDGEADMIVLPSLTAEDLNGNSNTSKEGIAGLDSLSSTPALSGAIPMAIFDAAIRQNPDPQFGSQFFDMMLDFQSLPCLHKIVDHIVQSLMISFPSSPVTLDYYIRQPVFNIAPKSAEYPQALGTSFARLKEVTSNNPSAELITKILIWLTDSLSEDLQEDVEQALLAILQRILRSAQISNQLRPDAIIHLLKQKPNINRRIISICWEVWPDDAKLKALAAGKLKSREIDLIQA